jgi:hypothetical protein
MVKGNGEWELAARLTANGALLTTRTRGHVDTNTPRALLSKPYPRLQLQTWVLPSTLLKLSSHLHLPYFTTNSRSIPFLPTVARSQPTPTSITINVCCLISPTSTTPCTRYLGHITRHPTSPSPSPSAHTHIMSSTTTPSLGKAQSQSREWYEPLVCTILYITPRNSP